MTRPTQTLSQMRQKAVFRLLDSKFKAVTRVTVGSATCENAAGADAVYRRFQELLEQHKPEGVVIGRVGCAGKCDMEPVVTVIRRGEIARKYVKMDPARVDEVFQRDILGGEVIPEYSLRHMTGLGDAEKIVALGVGADASPAALQEVAEAFQKAVEKAGLDGRVAISRSAVRSDTGTGIVAYVYPDGTAYQQLTPAAAGRIVTEHLVGGHPVAEFAGAPQLIANRCFPFFGDVRYFSKQCRLTLRNCGVIDPESLDEYLAVRGYEAAARVIETMTPEEVILQVKLASLRGRGGGGFATGLKWQFARAEKSDVKYIICNADEGDPGAFMDRSTIEGDPHTVIEGMIIGGYAIGARKGFVYIRAEYPLAIQRLRKAIEDAKQRGFLGERIFGSDWSFDVELRLGAGAFVCGEETALIHSIEGQRGMPRPRPPYPAVSGLWGKPTVINNVETLANIPVVILDGAEWFNRIGTNNSKGTKVFALAGDVANTGLIEVPMGTTLREVVYDIGGGIKDGRKFKAVQTGGPAGGCLPESMLDTPIDYDTLARAGSIMGSGGMIVMDECSCMVNVARFFIEFTQDESCGKCTPCREGTKRMLEILTRITQGQGVEGDVEKLLRLAETVKKTSLCGLGQAAPNPVISTITHFRDEYDAHIREKRCPTLTCRSLITYTIDSEACTGCTACARKCPVECIDGERKQPHVIDGSRCIRCGRCFEVCKFDAVKRK